MTRPPSTSSGWSKGTTTWPPPKTRMPARQKLRTVWPKGAWNRCGARAETSVPAATRTRQTRPARGERPVPARSGRRPRGGRRTAPRIAQASRARLWGPGPSHVAEMARVPRARTACLHPTTRLRAICHAVVATMAKAAVSRAWTQRASPSPAWGNQMAASPMARAEGNVKPAHAAAAPRHPARSAPMQAPSWLLAGPGRIWQRAERSAKVEASSHRLLATYSRWKCPMWAVGPPKAVSPSLRATRKVSAIRREDAMALEGRSMSIPEEVAGAS